VVRGQLGHDDLVVELQIADELALLAHHDVEALAQGVGLDDEIGHRDCLKTRYMI
jgi:hypothetical protein